MPDATVPRVQHCSRCWPDAVPHLAALPRRTLLPAPVCPPLARRCTRNVLYALNLCMPGNEAEAVRRGPVARWQAAVRVWASPAVHASAPGPQALSQPPAAEHGHLTRLSNALPCCAGLRCTRPLHGCRAWRWLSSSASLRDLPAAVVNPKPPMRQPGPAQSAANLLPSLTLNTQGLPCPMPL